MPTQLTCFTRTLMPRFSSASIKAPRIFSLPPATQQDPRPMRISPANTGASFPMPEACKETRDCCSRKSSNMRDTVSGTTWP